MSAGRRVLVTGASRGLGRALAEHFLACGDEVVGCSRSASSLEHPQYSHLSVDVAEEGSVGELFEAVRERWERLDVLVNNAGVAAMVPLALMPAARARQIVDVNLLGTFLATRSAVRLLRKSSCPRIVNLSSVAVPLRLEGEALYAAAKAAVESFTRIAARELAPLGITCNAVGPSPIRTDLVAGVPEETLEALVGRQAIRRWAEPTDVVNVVEFFLRPESSLVTAQVVYLGGIA